MPGLGQSGAVQHRVCRGRTDSSRVPAGSEKAAAHRLGLSHSTVKHHLANARSKVGAETTAQLVWILAPRLPVPEGTAQSDSKGHGFEPHSHTNP